MTALSRHVVGGGAHAWNYLSRVAEPFRAFMPPDTVQPFVRLQQDFLRMPLIAGVARTEVPPAQATLRRIASVLVSCEGIHSCS